ncbi:hypothetical protein LSH36_753g02041 [Paralvinella palmiformis]|uniref:C2H2-type domain-containing protein n=1 Tax=Paralvinella palmiformis TaxID=53620 RepID=A0AAD9MT49_9ANNE|nr:hypothetical protein LSH36_753g02041 [Paralvinella palmiformis]
MIRWSGNLGRLGKREIMAGMNDQACRIDEHCDGNMESYCELCDLKFFTEKALKIHFTGKLHQSNIMSSRRFDTQDSNIKDNRQRALSDRSDGPGGDLDKKQIHYCEVCDITCTGLSSLESHLNGQKHAKKLKLKQGAERVKKMQTEMSSDVMMSVLSRKKKRIAIIQADIDNCDQPLIGLDYVTEFQKEDFNIEPLYICDLCEVKVDCRQLLFHVTGLKHRMKYFKYHSPGDYKLLFNKMKKSEKAKLALHCAQVLEEVEGRHKVRLKVEKVHPGSSLLGNTSHSPDDPETIYWEEIEVEGTRNIHELPGLWKQEQVDCLRQGQPEDVASSKLCRPYSQRFLDPFDMYERPAVLPSGSRTMMEPASIASDKSAIDPVRCKDGPGSSDSDPDQAQIKKLLEGICSVENEEDAEVALQVSNALTKALLEYRMKSLEGTSSMQDTLDEVKRELKNLSKKAKSIPIPKKDNHTTISPPNNSTSTTSDGIWERNSSSSSSTNPTVKTSSMTVQEHHQLLIRSELSRAEAIVQPRLASTTAYLGQKAVEVKKEPIDVSSFSPPEVSEMDVRTAHHPRNDSCSLSVSSSFLMNCSTPCDAISTHDVSGLPQKVGGCISSSACLLVASSGQTLPCSRGPVVNQTLSTTSGDPQQPMQCAQSMMTATYTKPSGSLLEPVSLSCYKVSDRNQEMQRPPQQQSYKNLEHMAYSTAEDRSLSLASQCVQPSNNVGQYRDQTYDTQYGHVQATVSQYQELTPAMSSSAVCHTITPTSCYGYPGSVGSQYGQLGLTTSPYSQLSLTTSGYRQPELAASQHNQPQLGELEYHQPMLNSSQFDKLVPISTHYVQAPTSHYGQTITDNTQYCRQLSVNTKYEQSQPVVSMYTQPVPATVQYAPPQVVPPHIASSPQYAAYLASPEYKAYLALYHSYMVAKAKQQEQQRAITASSTTCVSAAKLQPMPPPLPKEPPPPLPPPPPSPPPKSPEHKRHRKM